MLYILSQILILFGFILIGYILGTAKVVKGEHADALSAVLVYCFLPSMIFSTMCEYCTLDYLRTYHQDIRISFVVLGIAALADIPLSRYMAKESYVRKVLHYSLTIGNFGAMGYPLCQMLYGEEVLCRLMLFTIPLNVYVYVIGMPELTKKKFSLRGLLQPAIIFMVLGMSAGILRIPIPSVLSAMISKAGSCTGPVSMILAGVVMSEYEFSEIIQDKRIYVVTAFRLLIIPLLAGFLLRSLVSSDIAILVLMCYAVPCGLNTIVFPKLVGEDCRLGAGLSLVSSLLCVITVPLCLFLIGA